MQLAIIILAILIVGAIVGSTLNFAGVFFGIPFVLIVIGVVIGKEFLARQRKIMQMKRFRRDARAQKFELSEADKRTTV